MCVSFLLSSSANAYMLMYRRISENNESVCVCVCVCACVCVGGSSYMYIHRCMSGMHVCTVYLHVGQYDVCLQVLTLHM